MALTGKSVLIIDDAADSRLIAKRILENAGVTVLEAASADEALRILEKQIPHLILLDLRLGGATGFDLLDEKRKRKALLDVPVIVVSSSADRDSIVQAVALGAADYAIKPINAWQIMQKIRKALKDTSFLSFRFDKEKIPKLSLRFTAQISRPTETAFYLESSMKVGPGTQLNIQSSQLAELGMAECVFIAEGKPNVRGYNGLYFTRVNVMGLKSALTRMIRKAKAG